MAQDTRSVAGEFDRQREPHKPTVHVRVDGLIDEDMVRHICREEIADALERVLGQVVRGLTHPEEQAGE